MSTPEEFAFKTDSGWAYPKEIYVHDGTTEQEAAEVYVWNGTEAKLVWPVDGYVPGLTVSNESVSGLKPADLTPKVFVPMRENSPSNTYDYPATTSVRDVDYDGDNLLPWPTTRAEYFDWEDPDFGIASALSFVQTDGYVPDWSVIDGTDLDSISQIQNVPILNYVDTPYNTWDFSSSSPNAFWNGWDLRIDRAMDSFDFDSIDSDELLVIGSPEYYNEIDLRDTSSTIGNYGGAKYGFGTDASVRAWTFSVGCGVIPGTVPSDYEDTEVSSSSHYLIVDTTSSPNQSVYPTDSVTNGHMDVYPEGMAMEAFPQYVPKSTWDYETSDFPYKNEGGVLHDVINYIDGRNNAAQIFGTDPNIAHITYNCKNGESFRIRFDNWIFKAATGDYNDSNAARMTWLSSPLSSEGNASLSTQDSTSSTSRTTWGIDMARVRGLTEEGLYEYHSTIFPKDVSEFYVKSSYPRYFEGFSSSYTVPGGQEYLQERFKEADWILQDTQTTGSPETSNWRPQQVQGYLFDEGDIVLQMRKPMSKSRLVWKEEGATVGSFVSATSNYFQCTPGTITDNFCSGGASMQRYNQSRLPWSSSMGLLQMKYTQVDGTDGDAKNEDGSFHRDWFRAHDYLELWIHNRTKDVSMRSYAWGDGSIQAYSSTVTSTWSSSVYVYNSSTQSTEMRPCFTMSPNKDNDGNNHHRMSDFFDTGDTIDFEIYSR